MTNLVLVVLLTIFSAQYSYGQFTVDKRRKGVYGAKKKYVGKQSGKKNKSYKPTSKAGKAKYKKNQKRVKHRKTQKRRRNKHIKRRRKNNLKGRSKSLYGNKSSKRKKKGRYPKKRSDMGSKLSLLGFTGVVLTGQGQPTNELGQLANVFTDYNPAPMLGGGFEYNHSSNLSFGANALVLALRDDNINVKAATITAEVKYYLGTNRSKVRPYGVVGITYSFAGINREGFDNFRSLDNGAITVEDSKETDEHILVESISKSEPTIQTALIPMLGYKLGIGADFKVNSNLSLFGEIDYQSSFARSRQEILEFFPANEGNFNFLTFKVGVKLNLLKSKSLY